MSTDYLQAVLAMLGEPKNSPTPPSAWDRLEAELGIVLPNDFKAVTDAYAPVTVNGHLHLLHPNEQQGVLNLGREIRRTADAWNEVSWADVDPDEDPWILFDLPELPFGVVGGLWPLACTDRGEGIFLDSASDATRLIVTWKCQTWAEYRMSFAEWLYRYLIGEDMAGPNSSAFYPGPVMLERWTPRETCFGPDRDM